MRILYVIRSVAHFSYHESVIKHLCGNGHNVHALFDRQASRHSSDRAVRNFQAGAKRFTRDWLIRRNDLWRRPLFAAREVLSYASYLSRDNQSDYYLKRWEGYLTWPARILVKSERFRTALAGEWAQSKLRNFEHRIPGDPSILKWLENYKPDVIVASPINMRFSEEIEYIKAAKILGIPAVVPVLSWDNLTTKGVFHVIPDLTLAWNRSQFESAVKIHRVPPDQIVVTGAPFFDKWFETTRLTLSREAFCQKIGIDPAKPFILYLGSSANIARDETWLVRDLAMYLQKHGNPELQRMNILIRPHPANAKIFETVRGKGVSVYPRGGTLPDSESSMQDFYNSLIHCVATIGINTTGMIDAVIVDRPCLSIMTDRYKATQELTAHFQFLLNAGVLEISDSAENGVSLIEKLLQQKDSKKGLRRRFVESFIRPYGLQRPAGDVVAQAIELAARGLNGEAINLHIASPCVARQIQGL